jgi:hypothetical protein
VSVTGDDEAITSNSYALCFVLFAAAEIISQIQVSDKDTGISRTAGNYTEGWVFLPPTSEADHATVLRRHAGSGVGITFDQTKLKATSAVRKQSTKELDFESKFKMLHKAATWTDSDWFTYDYAQMSLVLATAIFDYRDCKIFPYMFPQEGGCGGYPPWKNIHTAVSALYYFNSGKSVESILAVMDEATLIQEGKLEPRHAVYVGASHYAQLGDSNLKKVSSASKFLRRLNPDERAFCLELAKGNSPLPEELKLNSVVVDPKDKLLGSAVSELRANGLIMTELDVRLKQLGEQKFFDLMRNENMGIIRAKREEEKRHIKKNGLSELSKMAKADPRAIAMRGHETSILHRYYFMRSNYADITGFSYEGQIRIFKTSDVCAYYEKGALGLIDEVLISIDAYRDFKLGQKLGQAKRDLEYQIEWMESGELQDLFAGEIPPSIGSDDARIARKIIAELELLDKNATLVVAIITDDKDMLFDLKLLMRGKPNLHIVRVSVYQYLMDSLSPPRQRRSLVRGPHIFSGKTVSLPTVESEIINSINWRTKNVCYKILYDFPNINRNLEGYRSQGTKLLRMSGGCLRRTTARKHGWSSLEWEEFKNLPDFERKLRSTNLRI